MSTRTRITVEKLLQDLVDDRDLARSLGQPAAAIQATQLTARLIGALVDRKETGAPGEFANLHTAQDVLDQVRKEFGDEAAVAFAAALAKRPGNEPEVEPASPEPAMDPTPPEPGEPLN